MAEWDDRTFYDFIATSDAFAKLTYRHREVFGQVGFGTGGWDSDFTNTMLEILRVVAGFDDDQRLIVGGAEQLPRSLWAHEPSADEMVHWPVGTSMRPSTPAHPAPGCHGSAGSRRATGSSPMARKWSRKWGRVDRGHGSLGRD